MKAHFYVLAAVAALVMAPAVPTHAITYGEPDDGEHPYVGFMLFHDPSGWFSCSGSALADDVFLTAGHCLFNVTTDLEPLGSSGGTDAWVTFAEEPDLSDFPATADFPSIELRDEARLDWLQDAGNGYLRGTASPHPLYDDFASFPDTHDVGIAELDASAGLGSFAVLADLGALDENTTGQGHNKITVETAGYGIQEIVPVFTALSMPATSRHPRS